MQVHKDKVNDQKLQSLGIQLKYKTQKDKLIIQAYDFCDIHQYSGEILLNPLISFNEIKEFIQEGHFKIIQRNENILKIKIGLLSLQMISKQAQNKSLKENIQILNVQIGIMGERFKQFQNQMIQQQKRRVTQIQELKKSFLQRFDNILSSIKQVQVQQGEQLKQNNIDAEEGAEIKKEVKFDLTPLGLPISQVRWSRKLKSKYLRIDENNSKVLNTISFESRLLALMEVGFTSSLDKKQLWAIKIKNNEGIDISKIDIRFGICLKNLIQGINVNPQNFNSKETGHGFYSSSVHGHCWSHSQKDFNLVKKGFQLNIGDVIYMEYDPIQLKMRFQRNQNGLTFEMPIILPPQNDAYHPFVSFDQDADYNKILSVELILPGRLLS